VSHTTIGLTFIAGVFAGMLALIETGRRVGRRRIAKDPTGATAGFGTVDAAVFGLMGLLIAFTFSGAAARFDARRQLILEEANDIGTAYLRLDLLPPAAQPPLRDAFRQYVDARLAVSRAGPDSAAAAAPVAHATALQRSIWTQAVAATHDAPPEAQRLVLSALNAMFDITTARAVALRTHPPTIIFALMAALALLCALFAGYGMAAERYRSWAHIIGFAAIVVLTVYVIIDLENPRAGLIRIDAYDQLLTQVRQAMR
jgi:hypothetical protein